MAERRRGTDAESKAFGCGKNGEELPKWVADKEARRNPGRRRPNWRLRRKRPRQQGESAGGGRATAKGGGPQETGKPAAPPSRRTRPRSARTSPIRKSEDHGSRTAKPSRATTRRRRRSATAQVIVAPRASDAKQSDQHQFIADAINQSGQEARSCRRTPAGFRRQPCGAGGARNRRLYRAGAGQARGKEKAAKPAPPCEIRAGGHEAPG